MVELESDGEMTRSEVATFLREFSDEIDDGTFEKHPDREPYKEEDIDEDSLDPKRITFVVGGDSATVTVPKTLEFDVEIDSRSPMLSSHVNQEIEFELSWEIEDSEELGEDVIEIE